LKVIKAFDFPFKCLIDCPGVGCRERILERKTVLGRRDHLVGGARVLPFRTGAGHASSTMPQHRASALPGAKETYATTWFLAPRRGLLTGQLRSFPTPQPGARHSA
jgi:hypothetical protein